MQNWQSHWDKDALHNAYQWRDIGSSGKKRCASDGLELQLLQKNASKESFMGKVRNKEKCALARASLYRKIHFSNYEPSQKCPVSTHFLKS